MVAATTTHATLLARLADGQDRAAWSDFCARYGDLIRGFARRLGLQPADCDDILQDVLFKLSKTMPGFRYDPARGMFRSYLKTVVVHAVFDKSPQNAPGKPVERIEQASRVPDGQPQREDDPWEIEWRRYHVRLAMRHIEVEYCDRDVRAFQMYALDGREADATAAELGMSVDQVYQAKSQILKRLSALIAQQVSEEG